MTYSITCSPKLHTLSVAPDLFILFNIFYEFATAAWCICLSVPSGRRGTIFFLSWQIYTTGTILIRSIESFVITLLCLVNQFVPNASILYPLAISENGFLMFSGSSEKVHWEKSVNTLKIQDCKIIALSLLLLV